MPGFELRGKVSLDGSQWKAGLDQAERQAQGFSGRMATRLGGAIKANLITAILAGVATAVALAVKSLGTSAKIRDMAKRIGVTPERFQELDFAARQNGATGEQVVAAIKGLSKTQQRANEVDKEGKFKDKGMRETFAKFGVTDQDLSLPPAALFQVIAKRVGEGWNKKDALADLQKIMEEAGVALLPVFKSGMEETMAKARELGVIAGKDVALLAGLDDKKTDLQFALSNKAATATAAATRAARSAYRADASFLSAGPGAPPPVFFEIKRSLDRIQENTAPLKQ